MTHPGDKTSVQWPRAQSTAAPPAIRSFDDLINGLRLPVIAAALLFVLAVLIGPIVTDASENADSRSAESGEYEDTASVERPGGKPGFAWLASQSPYCEALSAARAKTQGQDEAKRAFDAMYGAITTCATEKKQNAGRVCRHTAHKVYGKRIFQDRAPPPAGL